jgi:hypothetical protein
MLAAHRSLIWFAVWPSLVHAAIMAIQAPGNPAHMGHMLGDVPALLVGAIVLGGLALLVAVPPAASLMPMPPDAMALSAPALSTVQLVPVRPVTAML